MSQKLWNKPQAYLLAALLTCVTAPATAEVRWSVSIGSYYQPWGPYGWWPSHHPWHARYGWGPSVWYSPPPLTYVPVPEQQVRVEPLPGNPSSETLINKNLPASAPSANPPSASGELVLEARNGQSPLQTQRDRSACMQQASKQPQAREAAVFQAALAGCLQERGYAAR